MTETQMIIVAVFFVAVLAVAFLARRSGPRITTIEHRPEKDGQ